MIKPFKPNYFSQQKARISKIVRKDGKDYTIRENKMRFFFPDEWQSFFDALSRERQKKTFNFLINTGARINEVRGITKGDIDFDRNSIIIRNTKSRNKDGSRKIRVISVSPQFIKWVRAISKDMNPEDKFNLLSTPAANLCMEKTLNEIQIQDKENFTVHSVRKTLECWLLALGVDSLKVSKHFGHTLMVASKYYVSPEAFSYEDRAKMREVIGDLYQRGGF